MTLRYPIYYLTCCVILGPMSGFAQRAGETVQLRDGLDSLSYVIGRDVGSQIESFGETVRMPSFSMGMQQALNGNRSLIDSAAADSIRRTFAERVQRRLEQQQQGAADSLEEQSNHFLDKNKRNKEVKTTSSGLQYMVKKKGSGPKPSASDSVQIMYKGMTLDNIIFDSTSQPVMINLATTIPGLAEGILLMNVGGSYRFFIPPELAYGELGVPPAIPPNAVLIFDVELRSVRKK